MAQDAIGMLLNAIAENRRVPPTMSLLDPELLVRASSAPPVG
jgi:DNA-binding LacI/PurR family transcriptional regulator